MYLLSVLISEKQLIMLRSWSTFLVIPRKQAKNIFFAHSDIHKKISFGSLLGESQMLFVLCKILFRKFKILSVK